nr:hypothetical protein BC936DRAFT_141695 [Ipomoea batatas]GME02283.1 hypothetical protein BC936DRAFT_141695 [Ipomoea batatas]
MKGNLLSLHLPVLHINLVSAKNNWNVLTHTNQITVPCGHILVCQSGSHIKHDNCTLSMDTVTIPKTTKFLLASSIPAIKSDFSTICEEIQWMHLHTYGGFIFLLEFTSNVPLHKCSFSCSTIANNYKLKARVINRLLIWKCLTNVAWLGRERKRRRL